MARWLAAAAVATVTGALAFWFALVHTVHRGTVTVPNLTGLEVARATAVLHDLGLRPRVDGEGVFSPDVPAGRVAEQEPPPGFHLKSGGEVVLRPSLGARTAEVPPVVGSSFQTAVRDLEIAGLQLGRRVDVAGEAEGEQVLATSPPAGTRLEPGAAVDLLVNTQPRTELWVMPSLLETREERARRWCRRHGLRVGQVHRVAYPGMPAGVVLRQYPPPGSPVSRADIVSLWVSE